MRTTVYCSRHTRARAAWRCDACGSELCPGCAYPCQSGTAMLVACVRCGGMAKPVTVHRSEIESFASRLPRTLLYPLNLSGVFSLAAVAAVTTLFSYAGILGGLIALGVYWGFLFSLIRATARGSSEIEPSDFSDPFEDIVMPAIRGVLGTVMVWLPAVVYVAAVHGGNLLVTPMAILTDRVVWLILVVSIAYVPMAMLIAAAAGSLLQMLNPLAVIGYIVRLGSDYAVALVALILLVGMNVAIGFVSAAITGTGIPFLSRWGGATLGLYVPVVMARVLGMLLYVRGDVLGYGVAEDYLAPAVPGAKPSGSPPAARSREPETQPVEIDIGVDRTAAEIAAAVQASDLKRAAVLYRTLETADAGIAPAILYNVARGAVALADFELAVRALLAAADHAADPVAPHALLALGLIYLKKLGDRENGRRTLNRLIQDYPSAPAAAQARSELASG